MGKDFIDFDSSEFEGRMKIYSGASEVAGKRALLQNAKRLEQDAKDTAPFDEGTLEGDIMANPQVKRAIEGWAAEVHAGTGSSRNYALRMHESMLPAVPSGDRQFKPGPGTAGRTGNPWGPAGGKYLTRPLMYKMKEFTKNIADAIARIR